MQETDMRDDVAEERPLVSVIMPTYNCANFISESIKSVVLQTVSDWEIEIVDDDSTDDTYEVIEPFLKKYPRIHYTKLLENGGPSVARTEAIRRARGQYVAFLDSDDIWLPEKLEKQIAFMKETGAFFSCTAYERIDEHGKSLHVMLVPPVKTDINKFFRLANPIGNLTVMYDQEKLGKYELPPVRRCEDVALWMRILRNAHYCAGYPEVLAKYRIRQKSVSRNKFKLPKYMWEIYHDVEGMSFFRSCVGVLCWAFVKGTGIGINKRKC